MKIEDPELIDRNYVCYQYSALVNGSEIPVLNQCFLSIKYLLLITIDVDN